MTMLDKQVLLKLFKALSGDIFFFFTNLDFWKDSICFKGLV